MWAIIPGPDMRCMKYCVHVSQSRDCMCMLSVPTSIYTRQASTCTLAFEGLLLEDMNVSYVHEHTQYCTCLRNVNSD